MSNAINARAINTDAADADVSTARGRVLFIGDTHANDRTPEWRNDNYLNACVIELAEALSIADERGCDAVVHLGDVFHRLEPSGECRNRILATFRHDEGGRPWPFRKFVVLGNHDIRSHIDNLERSALGTLICAGVVEHTEGCEELGLGFGHFHSGIEDALRGGWLQGKPPLIWALHAMVVTSKPPFDDYILFDEMPLDTACRLVVAGHYHPPLEQVRTDGARFINPGSVCRLSLKADELTRQPSVLLVDYALDGSDLRTEMITLTSCRPASEIFRIAEAEARATQSALMGRYLAQIGAVIAYTATDDLCQSLHDAGRAKGVPDAVILTAVKAVKIVQQR